MAFSAGAVWEVNPSGDDTNFGGGFDTGVAGFPTDGAATSATGSAPVFTSASYNFVAGDVGAWIFIKSGTNWIPGWYKIASVAANAATLTASVGSVPLYQTAASQGPLNTSVGCASTASPTGATWGIDYSQSTSARLTFTDLVIGGTTTQFTSAGNPVGKNFVGNILPVTSGTGFTVQRVVVISTSGTTATCDKSLGTGGSTGGNAKMGGCLASYGQAGALAVGSNVIWLNGSLTITTASTNTAGGCFVSGSNQNITIGGYGTYRGDPGRATLTLNAGVSSATLFSVSVLQVNNLILDGASQTTASPFTSSGNIGWFNNCWFKNFTAVPVYSSPIAFRACEFSGWNTQIINSSNGYFVGCEFHDNTATPVTQGRFVFCGCYDNSGASTDGFGGVSLAVNCWADNNGRDGFGNGIDNLLVNCVSSKNGRYGYNSRRNGVVYQNCAEWSNTSGNNPTTGIGSLYQKITSLSADPYVDRTNKNFAINASAGGGAVLRAAGFPGLYPRGLTTGLIDIGGAQSRATSGNFTGGFNG